LYHSNAEGSILYGGHDWGIDWQITMEETIFSYKNTKNLLSNDSEQWNETPGVIE